VRDGTIVSANVYVPAAAVKVNVRDCPAGIIWSMLNSRSVKPCVLGPALVTVSTTIPAGAVSVLWENPTSSTVSERSVVTTGADSSLPPSSVASFWESEHACRRAEEYRSDDKNSYDYSNAEFYLP